MTRALDLREAQIRALMRAARKEGVRVEVKLGEAVITVVPDVHTPAADPVDEKGKGYL